MMIQKRFNIHLIEPFTAYYIIPLQSQDLPSILIKDQILRWRNKTPTKDLKTAKQLTLVLEDIFEVGELDHNIKQQKEEEVGRRKIK